MDELAPIIVSSWLAEFRRAKGYIDGALAQLSDGAFFAQPAEGVNSVAIILKHLAGNMRSRWTDFLTSDGEKLDRNREREFSVDGDTREGLVGAYEAGWRLAFETVGSLKEADLFRTVKIRGEGLSVPDAVARQVAHYAYHAGQVLLIARMLHGAEGWKWQTVAPGGSRTLNQEMARRHPGFKPGGVR